jgi:hypothetical protein
MKTQLRSAITKRMAKKDAHTSSISHSFVEGLQITVRHYSVIEKISLRYFSLTYSLSGSFIMSLTVANNVMEYTNDEWLLYIT